MKSEREDRTDRTPRSRNGDRRQHGQSYGGGHGTGGEKKYRSRGSSRDTGAEKNYGNRGNSCDTRGTEKYHGSAYTPEVFRGEITQDKESPEYQTESFQIEGRNPVIEAYRSGKTIDRLYVQEGITDGPVLTILREAAKQDTIVERVSRERLDQMSETYAHQGVIAKAAAYPYASVDDILKKAEEKGEAPFIILLDNIEDPHNLGAIIRTANLCGAHGVIIPKRRSAGLTATAVKASAGAVCYTPVARVTNLVQTMEKLRKKGIWFVCADMDGEVMYRRDLTGPIGLVIGNEGDGVSRLVREKCDFTASIPMRGDIDSLNASVAAGVLAYEIVRQRLSSSSHGIN